MLHYLFPLIFTLFASQAPAIVGGQFFTPDTTDADLAKIASHTVVLLNTTSLSMHSRCTGTLVAQNIILTAAHCVDADPSALWVVTSVYEFSVSERHTVIKIIRHENYSSFSRPADDEANNDLALVQFSGDLPAFYHPTTWVSSFEYRFQCVAGSICLGAASAPVALMATVRGFIRSGRLRSSVMCSMPSLRSAPVTST